MNTSGFYEELPLESQMSVEFQSEFAPKFVVRTKIVIYWLFWWIAVEYIWQNSRKIVADKHTCPK
jgi:hypothetical protein